MCPMCIGHQIPRPCFRVHMIKRVKYGIVRPVDLPSLSRLTDSYNVLCLIHKVSRSALFVVNCIFVNAKYVFVHSPPLLTIFANAREDNHIFISGTSRKVLAIVDTRKPDSALIMRNDGMVNSLYVCRDGQSAITGDSLGYIKTWDMRTGLYNRM